MTTKNTAEWTITDEQANALIDQYTMQSSLAAEQVLTPEEIARISEQKLQEEQEYNKWCQRDWHE